VSAGFLQFPPEIAGSSFGLEKKHVYKKLISQVHVYDTFEFMSMTFIDF